MYSNLTYLIQIELKCSIFKPAPKVVNKTNRCKTEEILFP